MHTVAELDVAVVALVFVLYFHALQLYLVLDVSVHRQRHGGLHLAEGCLLLVESVLHVLHRVGGDEIDVHLLRLSESVGAADALVGGFKREVERGIYLVVAVLIVQSELRYLQFGDEHAELTTTEAQQHVLLELLGVGALHLDSVGQQRAQILAFVVVTYPDDEVLRGSLVHHLRHAVETDLVGLAQFLVVFGGTHGGGVEQHAVVPLRRFHNLLHHVQRWQVVALVVISDVRWLV